MVITWGGFVLVPKPYQWVEPCAKISLLARQMNIKVPDADLQMAEDHHSG